MQYKNILYTILITLAFSPVMAQKQVVVSKAPLTTPLKDTCLSKPGTVKPATPLIAGNLTAISGKYNHVPLAGDKSYFGDKNDFVKEFTSKYLERNNPTLRTVQNNSSAPFAEIDKVLEQKKLPKELKYIAVIESALNHNAVSSAGAVGTWQLMSETARMLGLSVSRHKDERRDLVKSTNAATKYLEILYSELNDWLLVAAAYNSGPTPVERAIQKTGSRSFWDIKQYLPQETQGYVLAFIATASIFEDLNKFIPLGSIPVDFKFDKNEDVPPAPVVPAAAVSAAATPAAKTDIKPATPIVRNTSSSFSDEELKTMAMVRLTDPIDLEYTAQEIGMDKNTLKRWNSDFDMFILKNYPTPFYNLRVPKDKLQAFLQKKEMLTKKYEAIHSVNK